MVTNIPTPYRLPVYELLAREDGVDFCVIFCSDREPDRAWDVAESGGFKFVFLKERFLSLRGRFIHFNPDVWQALKECKPDVVITTGFNPTHLIAFAFAVASGARHVAMTDGTYLSEFKLSSIHRKVRRYIYARSDAFIGSSDGTFDLYQSYGVDLGRVFKSHLCADNALFQDAGAKVKRFDFMFCGRFVALKNPLFALDVAREVARRLGRRISIVFVGSGELERELRSAAEDAPEIEADFPGFATQAALPGWYTAARVFLFPTQWEPWGVVANEACAAGLPVLISGVAGSANELVRNGENGFVLTLELEKWVDAAVSLLTDEVTYKRMSARSRELVGEYTYTNAASGIIAASKAAYYRGSSVYEANLRGLPGRYRVVLIQRRMTWYRVPLFELLRKKLTENGVTLVLVYGDPTPDEALKGDSSEVSWGVHIPCRYWFGGNLCWQNALATVRGADLIVLPQESKLLFNYVVSVLHSVTKWAFWGHGRNFQARNVSAASEWLKRWLARKVDWWFAYTELSAEAVALTGFPRNRISVLDNATDTRALEQMLAGIRPEEIARARAELGLGQSVVGLCMASLHSDKRLDFLIEAARRIRARVPGFELLIAGDGPEREFVCRAVADAGGWIHWQGALLGRRKALALSLARVILNPGMVGLVILDSFVAQAPLITTEFEHHSPEISYLESGVNGLMTANSLDVYVEGAVRVLVDDALLHVLKAGCRRSVAKYSIEHMAENFCQGILECLESPVAPNSRVKW